MSPEAADQAQKTQAPAIAKPKEQEEFSEFAERSTLNWPVFLLWIAAVIAILATLFFWWSNRNTLSLITDKNSEKDSIVAQLNSASYREVDTKAQNFKSSVSQLAKVYDTRYPMGYFLTTLYTKINSDVKLSNITLTSEGVLNIVGIASSYYAVGEQMVSLKSYDSLQEVTLTSSSINYAKNGSANGVSFAITANVDKAAVKTNYESVGTSTASADSISTTGGL